MITWISIDDSGYKGYIETQKRDVQVERARKKRGPSSHHLTVFSLLGISDVARYVPHQLPIVPHSPSHSQIDGKRVEKKEIKQAKRSRCQKDLLLPLPNVYFLFFLYTATYCFSYTAVRIILPSRSYSFFTLGQIFDLKK